MAAAPEGRRLIGRGRTADVYQLEDGLVLRRTSTPDYDATWEAHAMRLAASAGVPVPRVHSVAGRDLIMDRVDGPTMLEDLATHPEHLDRHAGTLADLHRRLDAVVIEDAGAEVKGRPPIESESPVGLVHGDLHPANVLLTETGPVLIDWTNSRFGPRGVDLAMTWIVLACFGRDVLAAAGVSSATRAALVDRSWRRSTAPEPSPACGQQLRSDSPTGRPGWRSSAASDRCPGARLAGRRARTRASRRLSISPWRPPRRDR